MSLPGRLLWLLRHRRQLAALERLIEQIREGRMVGGRKVWMTLAGVVLGTAVTVGLVELLGWSPGDALLVGSGIAGLFGVGTFSVAWEDRAKHSAGGQTPAAPAASPPGKGGGK
jgi:hypothetical protein